MRLLIVEDEPPIAEYIESCCRQLLSDKAVSIHTAYTLEAADAYLSENAIDLCLLDLNLNGEDGFEVLKGALARSFQTIVISAHTDQAVMAYELGVLDFVPKSLKPDRLKLAFDRFLGKIERPEKSKYLVIKSGCRNRLVEIGCIAFFKAQRYLVEAHLIDGGFEIVDKPLNSLSAILPAHFVRIHRSYMVNLSQIHSFEHTGQNAHVVCLHQGTRLPISRSRYKDLKKRVVIE